MQILIGYQMQVGHMERLVRSPLVALQSLVDLEGAGASHVTFTDEAGHKVTRDELTALARPPKRG